MSAPHSCRKCDAEMPAENQFCTRCGTPTVFRPPVPEPAAAPGPRALFTDSRPRFEQIQTSPVSGNYRYSDSQYQQPSGVGVTPPASDSGMNGISLAHGEVVKRVYELGRVERVWGAVQGTLIITDIRVLYRAEAKNVLNSSSLNREIHLKDVRGIGLATRRGMSAAGLGVWLLGSFITFLVALFAGLLLAAASGYSYGYGGSSQSYTWLVLFLLIWLVFCITVLVLRRRASVVLLMIYASDVENSPISVSGAVGQSGGQNALALFAAPLILILQRLGVIEADAAADAADLNSVKAVYAEIGAVILDLQSRGSLGVE